MLSNEFWRFPGHFIGGGGGAMGGGVGGDAWWGFGQHLGGFCELNCVPHPKRCVEVLTWEQRVTWKLGLYRCN